MYRIVFVLQPWTWIIWMQFILCKEYFHLSKSTHNNNNLFHSVSLTYPLDLCHCRRPPVVTVVIITGAKAKVRWRSINSKRVHIRRDNGRCVKQTQDFTQKTVTCCDSEMAGIVFSLWVCVCVILEKCSSDDTHCSGNYHRKGLEYFGSCLYVCLWTDFFHSASSKMAHESA